MRFSIRLALMIALLFLTITPAFSQRPELYVQTGHTLFSVYSVAFSPDGKTLASGGMDNTIRLWDVSSGQELRTLTGHTDSVYSVSFSPDGTILASGGRNTTKLWDVVSGKELRTFKGLGDSVAFSSDGTTLASGGHNTIKLWDVASGRELESFGGQALTRQEIEQGAKPQEILEKLKSRIRSSEFGVVYSIAFSPDGKTLASGSGNGLKLWNVASGQELRTLTGHSDLVKSVAFSPDGNTVASGSLDKTIRLWDVVSGRELATLARHNNGVFSVAFSPDGKLMASGSVDGIKLWDTASKQELKTLKQGGVYSIAFSRDGKTLVSGGDGTRLAGGGDDTIKLWDVASRNELITLKGHSNLVHSFAFSPDGTTLATGNGGNITIRDLASGQQLKTLQGHFDGFDLIVFSSDGQTLKTGSRLGTIVKLWDVASGQQLRTLTVDSNVVAFSPVGQTLATASMGSDQFRLAGRPLGTASLDSIIKLWDAASGQEIKFLKGNSGLVTSGAFSPDGKTLATGNSLGAIKLWDVASGQELKVLGGRALIRREIGQGAKPQEILEKGQSRIPSSEFGVVYSVAFSPDGKKLASGGMDKTIRIWDLASGQELKTLKGDTNFVRSVSFSLDGKLLYSASNDNTIKLWEISTGHNLASWIALDEKAWAVVTPDGLFDGSPAAWNKIIWRFNNNTFNYASVEAFFSDFYYPGLLTDIFAGKRPKAPADIAQKDRRQAQLELALADAPANATLTRRNVTIKVNVSQAPAGAQDVRLFRNGSLVKVWRGDVLQGNSVTLEITIPIVAGENQLTAYAFNHDNIKSSDATLTITGADSLKRKGVAYVLAVGVNEYANSQYNLKYAVADAHDFAAEIKLQQAKLKNYERLEVIALIDRDATKANILKSLADLSVKIQPEDALIIYFAGHGTAQQKRFYLIPHDIGYAGSRTQLNSAGLQNILAHSISDEELERAVEGIDAGQLSLVIDACNSGQALESEEKRRGPMNSKGLAQLAYEKGMYILTAAQSYQAAQEAERLGHGFLTYALVEEGLKTSAADREPKDGQVLLREWLDYATERVPQMQQEELQEQRKQGRQLDRIKFVEADSGNERSIQRPRVFYRREAETRPLVVAKP